MDIQVFIFDATNTIGRNVWPSFHAHWQHSFNMTTNVFWGVTSCILLICLWFNDAVSSFGRTASHHKIQTGW
jgi:hypothetical protein